VQVFVDSADIPPKKNEQIVITGTFLIHPHLICSIHKRDANQERSIWQGRFRIHMSTKSVKLKTEPLASLKPAQANPSILFPVQREESGKLFDLFVNAGRAYVAVARGGTHADVPSMSLKLIQPLLYLTKYDERFVTIGELAEGIGASLGWASRIAGELSSLGLLSRIRDEHDRRIVRLQLTPQAAIICSRLCSGCEAATAAALSRIAPKERSVIARFLSQLITELRPQR
jgi:DNA-binding MarR family transcriptional regulator